MSTATAPITTKTVRAAQFREQSRAQAQELTELRKKLAEAAGSLATLKDKKQNFIQDAASSHTPKPGAIAALNVAIDEAQVPFDGLTNAVRTKEGVLNQTKEVLADLEREIASEAQAAAYQARFAELQQEATVSAAVICEKIRGLVEEDLPRFDAARDALTMEIIGGRFAQVTSAAGQEARALIHSLMQSWMDGSSLAVRHRLLRANPEWKERGDIEITISNLLPPKR